MNRQKHVPHRKVEIGKIAVRGVLTGPPKALPQINTSSGEIPPNYSKTLKQIFFQLRRFGFPKLAFLRMLSGASPPTNIFPLSILTSLFRAKFSTVYRYTRLSNDILAFPQNAPLAHAAVDLRQTELTSSPKKRSSLFHRYAC